MKIRLLFLICIQLITMFPKPGMQQKTYAEIQAFTKHAINVNINKVISRFFTKYRDEEIKRDYKANTINLNSINFINTINNIDK